MELAKYIAGLAGMVGTGLVVTELNAWAPSVAKKLIAAAAWLSSPNNHDRHKEEWSADLNEQPGPISKLMWAWSALCGSFIGALGRSLGNVFALVILQLICPSATKLIFLHFTRWGPAARKMRSIGHDIPWCTAEVGLSGLIFGRYRFGEAQELDSPFHLWIEQNKQVHFATYLVMFMDNFTPSGLVKLRSIAPDRLKKVLAMKTDLTNFTSKIEARQARRKIDNGRQS